MLKSIARLHSHTPSNSIELLYAAVNRCQQNIIDSSIHHNWKSTSMIIKFPLIIIIYLQVFINIYSTILKTTSQALQKSVTQANSICPYIFQINYLFTIYIVDFKTEIEIIIVALGINILRSF